VAFFQLSGGSTGTPKLIPRTHNDYDYSIRRSNEICGITADTRYLNALPAAHNYAMSSPGSLGVFTAGGCVVLANDPSATLCFPLIEQHQINVTSLVPPAVSLWLQAIAEGAGNARLQSLKLLQVGGASFRHACRAYSGGDGLPAAAGVWYGGRAGELHRARRYAGTHYQHSGPSDVS
jgi:2,3-dihydroxybenzoate-AMP ligase